MNKVRGFGLVEMLVSLLLSSLMVSAMMHQYLSLKRHHEYSTQLLMQAFDKQLAQEVIQHSIRQAGFTPCLRLDDLTTYDERYQQAIPALTIQRHPIPSLAIHRMGNYYPVLAVRGENKIVVPLTTSLVKGQLVFIADCYHGEVQTISHLHRLPQALEVTLTQPLHFSYEGECYLGEWVEESFYLKRMNSQAFALFYQSHHRADKLVTSLADMYIKKTLSPRHRPLISVHLQFSDRSTLEFTTLVRS